MPFSNAANLYKARMVASGFRINTAEAEVDSRSHIENALQVKIIRAENIESVFEDELPSAYCIYNFFIYQNQDWQIMI